MTILTKSFLIAFASILIPPIISLVLLVIFQFVAGESDIYGCNMCA
ncbi:MAG TPA: hypothetical protein PKY82_16720 [Pyrinomonadaceae bacterium]|nr:hypothetical protein [Pyrinomonadaceae bacterium]